MNVVFQQKEDESRMNLERISSFPVMPKMSSLGVFLLGIFVFLPGGQCHACNAYAHMQKISYFHAFFDKDHLLSFSV